LVDLIDTNNTNKTNKLPSSFIDRLVWTPCLMHRWCVCIWWYILQNYNYKLHFQNLSIYHIPHVSMGTLATENLDVCTACDPWDSNIQLTMGRDRRQQICVGFVADIDIKILGVPPLGGRACLSKTATHAQRGAVIYFCQGFLSYMMPSMDGWWDGWMDGWKASRKRPRHLLLYVNYYHFFFPMS
jgi:hypothetical protein